MRRIALFVLVLLSVPSLANEDKVVIGAIGDSITKAANAQHLFDNPEFSWSTGYQSSKKVNSHFHRLKELYEDVKGFNYARSGAKAVELVGQVDKLNRKNPDYVTLAIGANDVCSWDEDHLEALDKFSADVESALVQLIEHNQQVKITMIPIPDMYNLYEVGKAKGCSSRWGFFGLCQKLLGSGVTESERFAFVKRWEHANASLADVAATYSDHVKYVHTMQDYPFGPEHVSGIDCFHPSVAGQNLLAEESWQAGWFVDTDIFLVQSH